MRFLPALPANLAPLAWLRGYSQEINAGGSGIGHGEAAFSNRSCKAMSTSNSAIPFLLVRFLT